MVGSMFEDISIDTFYLRLMRIRALARASSISTDRASSSSIAGLREASLAFGLPYRILGKYLPALPNKFRGTAVASVAVVARNALRIASVGLPERFNTAVHHDSLADRFCFIGRKRDWR